MRFFNKLENKFGKFAIKRLMVYVSVLYVIGFILGIFAPDYYEHLTLDVGAIMAGEFWRVITFILVPPTFSPIFFIFALYFYYIIGTVLENVWGSFWFSAYYIFGVILTLVGAFAVYFIWGNISVDYNTYFVNLALYLAYATCFPDRMILLFFIIPVKMKWIAYFEWAVLIITMVFGFAFYYLYPVIPNVYLGLASLIMPPTPPNAMMCLIAMINFYIFAILWKDGRGKGRVYYGRPVRVRRVVKMEESRHVNVPRHRCAVCGKTEADGEDTFRFCSQCEGSYEYCSEHLRTHIHVKRDDEEN